MKLLLLNGSPRLNKSNTLKIANTFIEGILEKRDLQVEQINIYSKTVEINHCNGCYNCWTKTPGKCIFRDSMDEILEKHLTADIIIWSFPLYYFSLPSKAKACLDRLLPLNLPFMTEERAGHTPRYDLSHQKQIVVSSGGLSTVENNFEALKKQFDFTFHDNYIPIFLAQSPLLEIEELKKTTNAYLESVKKAGSEFAANYTLPDTTIKELSKQLFPIEAYNKMANSSWEISKEKDSHKQLKLLSFTKQMAALYNPNSYKQDFVLEIEYTDYQECYQLVINQKGIDVISDDFMTYTTKIKTPYTIWSDISKGKISGPEALMEGKYKVLGNLDIMMNWDNYFGYSANEISKTSSMDNLSPTSNTNMNMMLIPWIIIWVIFPFNLLAGGVICLLTSFSFPIVFSKIKLTVYDKLSALFAGGFSILAILGFSYYRLLPFSFALFAFLWLVSLFTKIPLTAHYSNKDFGGEKIFKNDIFIKTNSILTACWGLLYLILAVFTWFTIDTALQPYLVLINIIPPILLGVFTNWFKNWYPKKVISGK